MSKYYTIYRKSRTYSGTDEIRTLWGVLRYVYRTYVGGDKHLASPYTLTITQHDHYEDVERKEYHRLRKIYEKEERV